MLTLDHLTVIAPSLEEGARHIRDSLGLDVPFGTRHPYMGTYNHRLMLGGAVYLEVIAVDPDGLPPARARWFGLDDPVQVRRDWDQGRRLRGWVANTSTLATVLARHANIFGTEVPLPPEDPSFAFTLLASGGLPLDGAAPSIIDHRGDTSHIPTIPDLGARLRAFTLEHPDPDHIAALYRALGIAQAPVVRPGPVLRYRASIETPHDLRHLI